MGIETISVAITTFIATIGPIDVATMFTTLTTGMNNNQKRVIALHGAIIAAIVLMIFALFGETLLFMLGITLAALRTSGGILLLLLAIEMVFARTSGATSTTADEAKEASDKRDIAVFFH